MLMNNQLHQQNQKESTKKAKKYNLAIKSSPCSKLNSKRYISQNQFMDSVGFRRTFETTGSINQTSKSLYSNLRRPLPYKNIFDIKEIQQEVPCINSVQSNSKPCSIIGLKEYIGYTEKIKKMQYSNSNIFYSKSRDSKRSMSKTSKKSVAQESREPSRNIHRGFLTKERLMQVYKDKIMEKQNKIYKNTIHRKKKHENCLSEQNSNEIFKQGHKSKKIRQIFSTQNQEQNRIQKKHQVYLNFWEDNERKIQKYVYDSLYKNSKKTSFKMHISKRSHHKACSLFDLQSNRKKVESLQKLTLLNEKQNIQSIEWQKNLRCSQSLNSLYESKSVACLSRNGLKVKGINKIQRQVKWVNNNANCSNLFFMQKNEENHNYGVLHTLNKETFENSLVFHKKMSNKKKNNTTIEMSKFAESSAADKDINMKDKSKRFAQSRISFL